jgi:phenylacetate-coenzyme A ligase PaaK-like adenylate-forming protein
VNVQGIAKVPDQDSLRMARLRRTLAAVGHAHPFYRARFGGLHIEAEGIRSFGDLEALPLTRKDDYTADPEAFRLDPSRLPADYTLEERVLWDVTYTTGTTSGRPSPFYNTTHDIYTVWDQARRGNEAEGLLASDRVANLYPVASFPTGAFLSVVRSTMILGCPVVHALTGSANSEFKVRNALGEALEKVSALRPTVLWGVGSFVRRFLYEARGRGSEFGEVRLIITSGEPVTAALRKELQGLMAQLGSPSVPVLARYAFTEMQGGFVQCGEGAAPQNVCPDLYYLEVVDPENGRRLADGETGMLAITHLHRRGTVLLRYLVGDLVTLSRAPCPLCGREGERVVEPPRRTGRLVKVRGMLVNAAVIQEVLTSLETVGEYQIVLAPGLEARAMDRLVIRLERDASLDPMAEETLRDIVIRRVREAVSLRPEVEFVERGQIYEHEREIKTKRVLDLRSSSK